MTWTVARILEATGGRLLWGDPETAVARIGTDTRSLGPGDCFVALIGERHDAHDYLGVAAGAGAACLVIQARRQLGLLPGGVALVEVEDTLRALGDLARYHLLHHPAPVVGITGSNGKTSTKEMVASILSVRRMVLKTEGNFNNLIGLPLTVLRLAKDHEAAVLEMGINVFGEMERLVAVAPPDVALITNIHPVHLEGLGSVEQVLAEKGRIFRALREGGVAVVNLDDERISAFAEGIAARKVTFALRNPAADVHILGDVTLDASGSAFTLAYGSEIAKVRVPVLGLHQAGNAVAAAAVALACGEPLEAVVSGLAAHRPYRQRMEAHILPNGVTLVDDTYNANPASVIAALEAVLAAAGQGAPVIAVLGGMRELGERGVVLHREVGRMVAALGVDRLVTVGELALETAWGAREAGMPEARRSHAETWEDAVFEVRRSWRPGAWVLVKGSRALALERVVEGILRG